MNDEFERESIYPREFDLQQALGYEWELRERLLRRKIELAENMPFLKCGPYRQSHLWAVERAQASIEDLVYYAVTGNEPEERIPF